MHKQTKVILKASDFKNYFNSPFSLYCDYNVDPRYKDASFSPYIEIVLRKGEEFHEFVVSEVIEPGEKIERYPFTPEGFLQALVAMSKGKEHLFEVPLFYYPNGLHGRADYIQKEKGKSIFGKYYYSIVETKNSKTLKDEHKLQAFVYNHIIGKIQGYTPETVGIKLNNGLTTLEVDYDEEKLFAELDAIRDIVKGVKIPSATFGMSDRWRSYADKIAIQNRDISLINGIRVGRKKKCLAGGLDSLEKIANCSEGKLSQILGPFAPSRSVLNYAKAIYENKVIIIRKLPRFSNNCSEIYLDFEGGLSSDQVKFPFLIGFMAKKKERFDYNSIFSTKRDPDCVTDNFLKFVSKIQRFKKPLRIYHWGNYEVSSLLDMCTICDVDFNDVFSNNLEDLCKIFKDCFSLPVYRYSIKDVSSFFGYNWKYSQEEINGQIAVNIYQKILENPDESKHLVKKLLDYNKDDCNALLFLKGVLSRDEYPKESNHQASLFDY